MCTEGVLRMSFSARGS
uniref:Uncharacterized protein n=1 Tax=Anguilla anguilla TaxID=7936 RepID=A0A0E9VSJ5_ANGAN